MKISIDENLCIGCGTCQVFCPKIFKLNEENKVEIILKEIQKKENNECILQAIEVCPVQAIKN